MQNKKIFSNHFFFKTLFNFLRQKNKSLRFATISSILNKILDLMPPVLVGWVIDSLNKNPPKFVYWFVAENNVWGMAIFLAALAVIVFGLESLFEWFYKKSFMTLAQDFQHDLRMSAYRHIQNKDMHFFDNHRLGDTMAILNDDVNQLERFLNNGFNALLQLLVLFLFSGVVLFYTSWPLALFGMVPVPMIVFGSLFYQKKVGPRYREIREAVGALGSRLENNLAGIQVVKSFTAEDFEYERVAQESLNYRKKNLQVIKLSAAYVPLIRMFVAIGFGGVLLLGSYWVLTDSKIITIGELVLFSMMIQRLLWPLTSLGTTLDEYERARASATRIFQFLESSVPDEVPVQKVKKPIKKVQGGIEFNQVSFSYGYKDQNIDVIRNLSFEIKPRQTIGFAGTTGSGKTTLIKLLLRLYEAQSGIITIDKQDIRSMTLKELRSKISLVSQDVYLFYGSIYENIAYGSQASSQSVSLKEIIHCAKQAQFHDFVMSLPNQYQTIIGERGLKLSGGQRQRLSIARALLKNAPILILDEATSSVDTETERAIQVHLKKITAGRTALIVAHRLSTIRHADRIFVLENGKIVEHGSHHQLLKKKGRYNDLWKIQIGEN